MIHTRAPQGHATKNDQEGFRFVAEGGPEYLHGGFRVTPADFFSLTWSLYRLQLSAMEATAAFWWTAGIELWQPRSGVARRSEARPGPSLAEMLRETRQDTYQTDDAGGEE